MPNPPTTQIVEQVDREAAQHFVIVPENSHKIARGEMDWNPVVQAFARHRIAALQSSRPPVADELCVRLGELLAKATKRPWVAFDVGNTLAVMKGKRPRSNAQGYPERRWPEIIAWPGFDSADTPKHKRRTDLHLIVEAINAPPTLLADQARVAEAEGVIEQCRATFDRYAGLHMAKQPSDTAKAAANQEMADLCANFLSGKGAGFD